MAETIFSLHAFYKSKAGGVDGFLSRPVAPGRWPAVVIGHEWFGLDDWNREFNRMVAAEGFVALTPDLYHGAIAGDHDEAARLKTSLDINNAVEELTDAPSYLRGLPFVSEKVGIVGFCMGGGLALLAGCRSSAFDALVVYHHSIYPDPSEVEKLSCPLQGHYGLADPVTPLSEVKALESQLQQFKKSYELHFYEGAGHGWLNPNKTAMYRPEAAKLSLQRTVEFFRKHLGERHDIEE